MGGKRPSNRISTTLPRTEMTVPRFEELGLLFIFPAVFSLLTTI